MTDFHESRDYTVNNDTAHHAYYDYHVHTGLDENHTGRHNFHKLPTPDSPHLYPSHLPEGYSSHVTSTYEPDGRETAWDGGNTESAGMYHPDMNRFSSYTRVEPMDWVPHDVNTTMQYTGPFIEGVRHSTHHESASIVGILSSLTVDECGPRKK
jgi:hypothetical protein